MSIIAEIAARRQQLLDGVEANEGDINLRIFEDFYPDEAHFIYELLQNAEDAGATEVLFELTETSCSFEHNGSRQFDERDIRGITGIFNSSKAGNPDKIGKFGVGFKSVFVYTETPIVYSREFSFQIIKLVLPKEVPSKPSLGDRTRFELPFNGLKKSAEQAYVEIKSALEQLSETTLLFLNNLSYIRWKVGRQEGAVLREEHSDDHVEVLKQIDGKEVVTSHWLRFAEPVANISQYTAPTEGLGRQKVAIAYELKPIVEGKSFDRNELLAKQMRIVPAVQGTVSVFFPADKETSGLRFHLHAPFVPELSRASIKDTQENLPLLAQLAALAAKSLRSIRDAGLLSGDFLAVLPNKDDGLPDRYQVIRRDILAEMKSQPLVPTQAGGFAPASRLLQSRAALKSLLTTDDLALVTGRQDEPVWAIGATQRNSNQDRFLASLDIPSWELTDLQDFLEAKLREPEGMWPTSTLNQEVLDWVGSKPFEWMQALYAALFKHCDDQSDYGKLEHVYFIKLVSGEIGTGSGSFFATGDDARDNERDCVDERVLSVGTKKSMQDDARHFLENIGVRHPNEGDDVALLLASRYGEEGDPPSDEVYLSDLKRMIALAEAQPGWKEIFNGAFVFKVDAPDFGWTTSARVFLDEPFIKTGLRHVHEHSSGNRRWPLSAWYQSCGISLDRVARFAVLLGCQSEFDSLSVQARCESNPNWPYLRMAPGQRWGNGINRDFLLSAQAVALVSARSVEASLVLWNALCKAERSFKSPLKACFQWTERGGPRYADSQLVYALRELEWVPQADSKFVAPSAAVTSLLPSGFSVDTAYKWLEAVRFGFDERQRDADSAAHTADRERLGFKSEDDLEQARAFLKIPQEERRRLLEQAERNAEQTELPDRPVRNPELRSRRVGEEARGAPDKESEIRERSVQIGAAEAKSAAKAYLLDQYTNSHGQMVCQVCKGEMPFKLPSGGYYFEAVELISDMRKRYREAYLALCPNHAAAYQYANSQRHQMEDLVMTASGNEVEIVLGGKVTTIYFTQMHLADARACLESMDDGERLAATG